MKTKLSVLALAICGLLAFTSCDDDDDNYVPEQTVTKAFDEKYPNAGRVEWENKTGYLVADFMLEGNDTEAWFDTTGKWLMTKTEIPFAQLPELVRKSLRDENSVYYGWRETDIDKLERADAATIYIIEVEQGENEVDLYYAEDGTLIKVVADNDNNDLFPVEMPKTINDIITEMYPGATILDFDTEFNGYEVDIRHNNIYKDVYFDTKNAWVRTEWDIRVSDVPTIVIAAFNASDYKDYRIEDAEQIERPDGTFYKLELEQRDNEFDMIISAQGEIISTTPNR